MGWLCWVDCYCCGSCELSQHYSAIDDMRQRWKQTKDFSERAMVSNMQRNHFSRMSFPRIESMYISLGLIASPTLLRLIVTHGCTYIFRRICNRMSSRQPWSFAIKKDRQCLAIGNCSHHYFMTIEVLVPQRSMARVRSMVGVLD